MAVAPSLLYRGTLTNTNATLKTTDAVATTVVTSIIATNKTASAATFTISVNGFYFAYQMPIAAYQTVTIDVKQVTGTNINIQGLASANSTVDVSISGVVSTGPADQAWTSYTPTLSATTTPPTGWTQNGVYVANGRSITAKFHLTCNGNAGSGYYKILLPKTARNTSGIGIADVGVGIGLIYDSSSTNQTYAQFYIPNTDTDYCYINYQTSLTGLGLVSNSAPWAGGWGTNDFIRGQITYEAA